MLCTHVFELTASPGIANASLRTVLLMTSIFECPGFERVCALCGHDTLLLPSQLPHKQPQSRDHVQLNFRSFKDTVPLTVVSMEHGFKEFLQPQLICGACFANHNIMWVRPATGYRAKWLHTKPTKSNFVLVSPHLAFEVGVLRWFEQLFICDGTRFGNFAAAFKNLHSQAKPMFEKDFLHAYVLWSTLTWTEKNILETEPDWLGATPQHASLGRVTASVRYIDCDIGHHGNNIEQFLATTKAYWMKDFLKTWLTDHAAFCTEECAKTMIHDGSGKNYRYGCPVEVDRRDCHQNSPASDGLRTLHINKSSLVIVSRCSRENLLLAKYVSNFQRIAF